MELYIVDIVHNHKIKMNATRPKIRKINGYCIENEICVHYAFVAIIILVAI